VDSGALAQIFSVEGAAWTATTVFMLLVVRLWSGTPALLDRWLAFRESKASEKSADWSRLRDEIARLYEQRRLDREEQRIERESNAKFRSEQLEENDRCRRELAEVTLQLSRMQGFTVGRGEGRQEASVMETAKRIVADKEGKKS
jgi:hypothetical protein